MINGERKGSPRTKIVEGWVKKELDHKKVSKKETEE